MSPSESDINRKEWVDIYGQRCFRMLDCYDFSDDRQFLISVFHAFCFYVENILVRNVSYKEVLQQRENYTRHKKLQYIGRGKFTTHICANPRVSYYEEDEYREVQRYVDMRKLKFKKDINQSSTLEYLKKYKLVVGTI